MSEQDVAVVDETPPPDVVQPVRARSGAYKLCMGCGKNVLRFQFAAGSSECAACVARAQIAAAPDDEDDMVAGAAGLDADDSGQGEGEAPGAVDVSASVPGLDPGHALAPQGSVQGSQTALAWLEVTCRGRAFEALTLDMIAAKLRSLLDAQAQMIGRVTRYGVSAGEVRPEDVPLETAAQALRLACDPVVQERLDAACEVLRLALNQVILGNLAYHEQDLLDQDPSLVPQASYAAQYGTGVGRGSARPAGRTGMPGGKLVDADGRLVKDCKCCGRTFHPPAQRPNPDFCDDACGTFADQLRIWAQHAVGNEVRNPGNPDGPMPEPQHYWPAERITTQKVEHARAFRAQYVAEKRAAALEQLQKMRGYA